MFFSKAFFSTLPSNDRAMIMRAFKNKKREKRSCLHCRPLFYIKWRFEKFCTCNENDEITKSEFVSFFYTNLRVQKIQSSMNEVLFKVTAVEGALIKFTFYFEQRVSYSESVGTGQPFWLCRCVTWHEDWCIELVL